MQLYYSTLVEGWRYRLFASRQKSRLYPPFCKLGVRESNILSVFWGLIALFMSTLPIQAQQTACWVSPTKPNQVSAKTEWTVNQAAGTVTIRTTFAKTFVDNTYGTNAVGWGSKGHKFKDLTGSDKLQLSLKDVGGTERMNLTLDYISDDKNAPSKYRTLGVSGGEGKVNKGSAADVVSVRTSISENLNTFGYVQTTNSPATNANYAPNNVYPNWIFDVWYEVTVKQSAFPGGFGEPVIAAVHASPSKTGVNEEEVEPTLCPKFDLALDKKVKAGQAAVFAPGDNVTFTITVYNQGNAAANSVIVTDYIPSGLTLNDPNWTSPASGKTTRTIPSLAVGASASLDITFKVQTGVNGTIINKSEISSASGGTDDDSTPDNIDGNQPGETDNQLKDNVINENGKTGGDEDDHDLASITIDNGAPRFDLALRKKPTDGQPLNVKAGDIVSFTIEVFNQGNIDATNVVITDYIPADLTLNDANWTASASGKTTFTIPSIAAGASEEVEIIFSVNASPGTSIINKAEISSATGGTDVDSTPDATDGNQPGETGNQLVNDAIDQNGTTGGDEDDHDLATLTTCDLPLGGSDLVVFPPSTSADLPDAQAGQSWSVLSRPAGSAATITTPGGIVSGMSVNGVYRFVLSGTAGCNDTVSISRAPSPSGDGELCWISPTKPNIVSAKMTWVTDQAAGTVKIRTTFARTFVDNTYGTNAIGWPVNKGHKFKDLTGSDHLQLALFDGTGAKKIEFKIDYITTKSGTPSGYGTLGVTGGDGKLIAGPGVASDVVGALTSMDVNFNQFGYKLETDSPLTDADYTPNPAQPNWIFDVWYEVTVKLSLFGAGGFGQPYITGVHASPSKTGSNTEIVIPGSCPVAFAEANDVCEGGTINLLASSAPSGSTFTWTGPGGFFSTEQSPVITNATTDDAGVYTLTTKLNQNTATDTVSVKVFPVLVAPVASSNVSQICGGDTLKLFGSGEAGAIYSWKGPNQFTSSLQNPKIPNATAALNGEYILTISRNGCTAADTVLVTLRDCCPTITTTDDGRDTLCSNYFGSPFTVNYANFGNNEVQFVMFTTPQSGSSMYTGGTPLTGSTSGNGIAKWPTLIQGAFFPGNNGTTPVNYYVYAILKNLPTDANCRPSVVKVYTVLPLPKFTTELQPICIGNNTFDLKVTIQTAGTYRITLARAVAVDGPSPFPGDVITTQTGAAGNGAVTTLSVPIADTTGFYVIVQNELTGCGVFANSGKPALIKAPKWTLSGQPGCAPDKQTYSITFTVTGKNGTIKADKGVLTGNNPYTITGIPSGATLKLTDSLSAVCKFDTLITGPNCNCTPNSPILLTPSFTICKGDTFPTIRATVVGLAQVEWFTTPTGGAPVFVGLNFKPAGTATADIIYYAQSRITDPQCPVAVSSPRVTSTITVIDCCPTITTTDNGKDTLCSGYYGEPFGVSYTGTNEVQFVMFTTPQSGSSMYSGGTVLNGSASGNGTAQWPVGLPGSQFPANNGTAPVNYYVYAILKNLPTDANCRPAVVKVYTVLPLPKFTAVAQPACIGDRTFDLKVTIQTVGTFKITLARNVASIGNGPIPTDIISTQSGAAGNGATTTISVPIADSTGFFVVVQDEATGCAGVGNSGKPIVQDCNKEIDLALKKTINKKVAKIGDLLTYTIKVWNESTNNATGVAVTDTIATTVQFQAGTFVAGRGSASITGNVISWNIGNIAANGDTVTLTYQVKATQEGVHFNTAQICKANEIDTDSTPCNDDEEEDDIDTECFSVPFKLCPGEKVEVRIPSKYTNVKWFKGATEVTSIAGQSVVLLDDVGSYTFTAINKTCLAEGCCPIIIEPGDNCCPVDLCIPFTIQKRKK